VSIAPGTRLGQYEVQDFIGQGAMGLVYRAYHSELERTGAVKVMQALTPDTDTAARFRHEAQAIAQMRHPNIVNVYDFGSVEGTPYMIVEYVPGGSLAAKMAAGPLDRQTALKYLRGIAAGLDYAHGRGVVHRDVKPANVLLSAEDTPVLADFGLARLIQGSSLKSMSGVTTGTPAYMAPEQVTGSRVGPAADRYSLATIAYEMVTGAIPFDGEGLMELLYAQVHRDPPPPSSRNPSLGPDVDAVILRGLAKDPEARWESSAAFVDALAAALEAPAQKTMVMARPPRSLPAAGATPQAHPSRRPRRLLLAAIAAAVIVLLLVGVLALVALSRTSTGSLASVVSPAASASPSPSPIGSLTPTPLSAAPAVSLLKYTVHPGDAETVGGMHFPGTSVVIYFVENKTQLKLGTAAVSGGQFVTTVRIPTTATAGPAAIRACYTGGCAFATISIA
jgi:eukaryotic-like serine/threonine-protein kinase